MQNDMRPNTSSLLVLGSTWVAVAFPTWLTASSLPSTSFPTQIAAVLGWGVLVAVVGGFLGADPSRWPNADRHAGSGLFAVLLVLAMLGAGSAAGALVRGSPWPIALSRIGLLIASGVVLVTGYRAGAAASPAHGGGRAAPFAAAFLWSLLVAGGVNAAIAVVQATAPEWTDGFWMAGMRGDDRPAGNIRQPNFLATQVLWAIAAAAALCEMRRLPVTVFVGFTVLLLPVVVLTGSRIGFVAACLLTVWGGVDRRMSRATRWTLCAVPLLLLLDGLAIEAWSRAGGGGRVRPLSVASGRYAMWADTLSMIAADPWWGVGMGEFNFAWTLTPSARRSDETFTHTHNLFLQWAVETGLPATLAMVALLAHGLRRMLHRARIAGGDEGVVRRCAVVVVGVVLLHSQTEYPLWFAYFLLPAAFAMGLALSPMAQPAAAPATRDVCGAKRRLCGLSICGLLLILGGAGAIHDYRRVAAIYSPPDAALPEAQRIAEGRKALLFGHHADRLAGTLSPKGERDLQPYRRAVHEMLDLRLLMSWAQALDENGETDRARYVAARVREFDGPIAQSFFVRCDKPRTPSEPLPFQCTPPARQFGYRDFR